MQAEWLILVLVTGHSLSPLAKRGPLDWLPDDPETGQCRDERGDDPRFFIVAPNIMVLILVLRVYLSGLFCMLL